MHRKLLTCLSLVLTSSLLGACSEDLNEADAPEILITHSGALVTKESGETATFSMVLSADPGREVVLNVFSSDISEGVVEPSLVVLDKSNWFVPIAFTVTGLKDGIVDGDIDYKIKLSEESDVLDAHLLESVEVDVKNIDIDVDVPDPALFKLSSTQLITTEGGPELEFSLVLGSQPTADVVVALHVSDDSEGSVDKSTLSFSPENWDTAQIVKVNPLTDGIVDGDQEYVISFGVSSTDKRYHNYTLGPINVTNLDVDVAIPGSFTLSSTELLTSEDGPAVDFSLVLGSQPTADVVVSLHVSDDSEGSVDKSTLSFSPENWDTAQMVKVNPLLDGIVDGDQEYVISFGVSSTDKRYHNYTLGPINVTNLDVDLPPASFKLSLTKLVTRENGPATSFSLALGSKPTADVVVDLSVSDGSEGSININRLSFSPENWQQAKTVTVSPMADGIVDGDQNYVIEFDVSSADARYYGYKIEPVNVTNIDVDYPAGSGIPIRVVAANITSGNSQSYDEGHGIRIFQALKADIIMIQEFNMKKSSLRDMVNTAFGSEFEYTVGEGSIPNGIVSRFPIIEHGAWESNITTNRDWDWAVVDVPGPKDVLVVSVHLNTKQHDLEMEPLKAKIKSKAAEGDYYVLLGGDFNTKSRARVEQVFPDVLEVKGPYPVDQNNVDGTNMSRKSPYDWVLCCPAWAAFEVPVVIGSRSYPNGHVFDSRVYNSHGELGDVVPVEANDSGSSNMQHMAIVRDFVLRY